MFAWNESPKLFRENQGEGDERAILFCNFIADGMEAPVGVYVSVTDHPEPFSEAEMTDLHKQLIEQMFKVMGQEVYAHRV